MFNDALADWLGLPEAALIGACFPDWAQLNEGRAEVVLWSRPGRPPLAARVTVAAMPGPTPLTACFITPVDGADALLRELQHRLRNGMALIRSVFRRTAQNSESVDQLSAHFLGRLDAIARVQSNIALNERYGVDLSDLVMEELAAHALQLGDALTVEGPDVRLRSKPAETLSLAVHEVVTNSVKHGALGAADGSLDIRWWLMETGALRMLCISWTEKGVEDLPEAPFHQGFGYDLLNNSLPFELKATGSVELLPDGLRLMIVLPATDWLLHDSEAEEAAE